MNTFPLSKSQLSDWCMNRAPLTIHKYSFRSSSLNTTPQMGFVENLSPLADFFCYWCVLLWMFMSVNVVLCVNTYRGQKRELVGLFWLITLNFIPLSLLEPRTALTLRKPHWTPCLYQNSVEFMHRGAKGLNSGPNVYAASIFIHHSSTKLSISPLTTVNYESLLFFGILVLSIPGYKILGS